MKVKAKQTFNYENEQLEEGEVYNLPESVAKQAIEKDYAEKVEEEGAKSEGSEEKKEETPKIEKEEEGETPKLEGPEEETTESEEDAWGKIEKKLDEEPPTPPTWNPSEDESGNLPDPEEVDDLKGAIKDIRKNVGRNENDVITVATPDDEDLAVWKHIALKGLFEKAEIGDHVAIRFTGVTKSQAGRKYHNYRYELYDKNWNHKDSG